MSDMNWLETAGKHWGKIIGGLLGLIFALLVVNYGFWMSLFIFVCIAIGILVGWRLDIGKDVGIYIRRFFSTKDDSS